MKDEETQAIWNQTRPGSLAARGLVTTCGMHVGVG